jgi:hypothetical protein
MMDSGMSGMLAEDPIYLTELALIASKPAVPYVWAPRQPVLI